jgi:hypothetical protein
MSDLLDLIDALRSMAKRKHDDLSLCADAADALERLVAERDTFYTDYRMKCDKQTKALHVQIDRLTAERDALLADAERWRMFLSTRPPETHEAICCAIDAARSKT